MTTHPRIITTLRRAALAGGRTNIVDLLVRVQAPERPQDLTRRRRPDLNIALVIDRSGSMSGKPLEEACKAARFVVDHLEARDRCAIVVYDQRSDILVPAQHVGSREAFHRAIGTIRPGGNTDLHQGWLAGAEALAPFSSATAISRVILLSDGNANAGVTDGGTIAAQVTRLAAAGVTTSTLGLGRDFNEGLMTDIARAGHGRAYYGETAEDLMGPFREEFDLLDAVMAHRVSCLLRPVPGVALEVLNPYPRDAQGRIQLPDIAWGSEAVIAVRLTVPASMMAGTSVVELLSASLGYTDLDGQTHGIAADPIVVPVLEDAAVRLMPDEETVARRFGEVEAAQLQARSRIAALGGDWPLVEQLIRQAREIAAANPWVAGILDEMEALARQRDSARFAKEAMYASHAMGSRLSALEERSDLGDDSDLSSFLERKLAQGKARRRR